VSKRASFTLSLDDDLTRLVGESLEHAVHGTRGRAAAQFSQPSRGERTLLRSFPEAVTDP
jgi:hypothetical protein